MASCLAKKEVDRIRTREDMAKSLSEVGFTVPQFSLVGHQHAPCAAMPPPKAHPTPSLCYHGGFEFDSMAMGAFGWLRPGYPPPTYLVSRVRGKLLAFESSTTNLSPHTCQPIRA